MCVWSVCEGYSVCVCGVCVRGIVCVWSVCGGIVCVWSVCEGYSVCALLEGLEMILARILP